MRVGPQSLKLTKVLASVARTRKCAELAVLPVAPFSHKL